jgi:hypothetical protein
MIEETRKYKRIRKVGMGGLEDGDEENEALVKEKTEKKDQTKE